MKLRFSRSSLNLIIFTCIILIGWASIDKNRLKDSMETDLSNELAGAKIDLKPLDSLNAKTWTSQEGIRVIWQSRRDTDFLIRVRAQRDHRLPDVNFNHIDWQPHYWQWDINLGKDFNSGVIKLREQLSRFPQALKGQAATVVMQGPWSANIAQLTSARIIKDLALSTLPDEQNSSAVNCPWQPVAAQFWLQDQLLQANLSQPNMLQKVWQIDQLPTLSQITPSSLAAWKTTFVKQWQSDWLKPKKQFDMLSDLAYYRLPANYLLQGYWRINELTPAVLEDYLTQCQSAVR